MGSPAASPATEGPAATNSASTRRRNVPEKTVQAARRRVGEHGEVFSPIIFQIGLRRCTAPSRAGRVAPARMGSGLRPRLAHGMLGGGGETAGGEPGEGGGAIGGEPGFPEGDECLLFEDRLGDGAAQVAMDCGSSAASEPTRVSTAWLRASPSGMVFRYVVAAMRSRWDHSRTVADTALLSRELSVRDAAHFIVSAGLSRDQRAATSCTAVWRIVPGGNASAQVADCAAPWRNCSPATVRMKRSEPGRFSIDRT